MKILIRAAFMVLSVTMGIPSVASAMGANNAPSAVQQDNTVSWTNG